ncbi:phototropin 1 [Striga asiatica]|uniref:Phototropin 1 n=1 Tax=Striga asiatica TaxID=4170 RepID=A0A5A7R9Q6_STRAF|nr:phototropin 1 [Striga asiatica]
MVGFRIGGIFETVVAGFLPSWIREPRSFYKSDRSSFYSRQNLAFYHLRAGPEENHRLHHRAIISTFFSANLTPSPLTVLRHAANRVPAALRPKPDFLSAPRSPAPPRREQQRRDPSSVSVQISPMRPQQPSPLILSRPPSSSPMFSSHQRQSPAIHLSREFPSSNSPRCEQVQRHTAGLRSGPNSSSTARRLLSDHRSNPLHRCPFNRAVSMNGCKLPVPRIRSSSSNSFVVGSPAQPVRRSLIAVHHQPLFT